MTNPLERINSWLRQARAYFAELTPEPEPGTYAYTARFLAASGLMSGDEADAWKGEMKERDLLNP